MRKEIYEKVLYRETGSPDVPGLKTAGAGFNKWREIKGGSPSAQTIILDNIRQRPTAVLKVFCKICGAELKNRYCKNCKLKYKR